jgi:hypothetical protein
MAIDMSADERAGHVDPDCPDAEAFLDALLSGSKITGEADARAVMERLTMFETKHIAECARCEAYGVPQKALVNWVPLAVSMIMLALAAGAEWPYGFYQLLRLVVCGTAVYVVVQTMNQRQYWPWVMAGIAILFNPVFPISFELEQWQAIDLVVAIVFLVALFHRRPQSGDGG